MHRCILAEAIWKSQPLKGYFASCGLDVERPYLNHGSVDQYDVTSEDTAARTPVLRARPSEFLDAAATIGAKLCRDAMWSGKHADWTGASMEFIDNTWITAQRSFGGELYNGTSEGLPYFSDACPH